MGTLDSRLYFGSGWLRSRWRTCKLEYSLPEIEILPCSGWRHPLLVTDPQWLITCWISTEKTLLTHLITQYYYKHCIADQLDINHCLNERLRLDLARLRPKFWDEVCTLWSSWIKESLPYQALCGSFQNVLHLLNPLKLLFHLNKTCYCFSLWREVHSTHPWHQLSRVATPQTRGSCGILSQTVRDSTWLVRDTEGRSLSRKLAGPA